MAEVGIEGIWALADTLGNGSSTASNRSAAEVTRIDNEGTVWVHLPGGTDETPINGMSLSSVNPGDIVQVEVSDGRANVVGNATAPSVGAREVTSAVAPVARTVEGMLSSVTEVSELAKSAEDVARAAQQVAEATGQHFWERADGAHVTEITRDEWEEAEDDEEEPTGANSLWNSLGMLFRDGLNNLLALVTGSNPGVAIYDGEGNSASNIVGSFTGDGVVLGRAGETHAEIDYHSLQLIDKEGGTYFHVSDLRDDSGVVAVTDSWVGDGVTTEFILSFDATSAIYTVEVDGVEQTSGIIKNSGAFEFLDAAPAEGSLVEATYTTNTRQAKAFTFGSRGNGNIGALSFVEGSASNASGRISHAEGDRTTASGRSSHAEGLVTTASGNWSHAEGSGTIASGRISHAEGYDTIASGMYSHAEGSGTRARENSSHAEGSGTIASGRVSHAEGSGTRAYGQSSHAEGDGTMTYGFASHAQNNNTKASGNSQTAIGKYNEEDTNDVYALIVGNGTGNMARSNALTVDWNGNVECGDINGVDVTSISGTTYSLSKSGSTITLTGSDGSSTSVEDSDTVPQTASTSLTLSNLGSGTKTLYLYRYGNIVYAEVSSTTSVAAANTSYTAGTIPTGYRPARNAYQGGPRVTNNSLNGTYRWAINTSGAITFVSSSTGTYETPLSLCWYTTQASPS